MNGWNLKSWWFGRWFSFFLIGWFLGSMLILRGVSHLANENSFSFNQQTSENLERYQHGLGPSAFCPGLSPKKPKWRWHHSWHQRRELGYSRSWPPEPPWENRLYTSTIPLALSTSQGQRKATTCVYFDLGQNESLISLYCRSLLDYRLQLTSWFEFPNNRCGVQAKPFPCHSKLVLLKSTAMTRKPATWKKNVFPNHQTAPMMTWWFLERYIITFIGKPLSRTTRKVKSLIRYSALSFVMATS